MGAFPRKEFDVDAYVARVRGDACFICALVNGESEHEVISETDDHIAFLSAYPTLLGHTLVSPKRHIEDIVDDLDPEGYLAIQALVHRVARALKRVVPTERMYVMSLGSAQGNAHIHWHVAPLPPGVPYRRQQYHALMSETAGILDMSKADTRRLGERIRAAL